MEDGGFACSTKVGMVRNSRGRKEEQIEEEEATGLTILVTYRENTGDGVIRGFCPDHWRNGRVEMVEDGCRRKGR
jgi:hypothetical protein